MNEADFERFVQGEGALAAAVRAALPAFEPSARFEQSLHDLAAQLAAASPPVSADDLMFEPPPQLEAGLAALAASVQQAQQGRRDAVLQRIRTGEDPEVVLGNATAPQTREWLTATAIATPAAKAPPARPRFSLTGWWHAGASLAAALAVMLGVGLQWLQPWGRANQEAGVVATEAAASATWNAPASSMDMALASVPMAEPMTNERADATAAAPPPAPVVRQSVQKPVANEEAVAAQREAAAPERQELARAAPSTADTLNLAAEAGDARASKQLAGVPAAAPALAPSAPPAPPDMVTAPAPAAAARSAPRRETAGAPMSITVARDSDPLAVAAQLQAQLPSGAVVELHVAPTGGMSDWLQQLRVALAARRPDVRLVEQADPNLAPQRAVIRVIVPELP